MKRLSKNLISIYDLELKLGNQILRIDEPAGTKCPFAVVFRDPLHFEKISQELKLPRSVHRWENRDRHYPLEASFVCEETGHVVSGSLSA